MGSTSLENSPNHLLKLNAGTSYGSATLRSMCSPMEKWTRVHRNTRTSQTLPRAVDFPAPRPGLMMVPPGPPLLRLSDRWVALHTPLCPETSFQTCLLGDSAGLFLPPCDPRPDSTSGNQQVRPRRHAVWGCRRQLQHPGDHRTHLHLCTQRGSILLSGPVVLSPLRRKAPFVRSIFKDQFVIPKSNLKIRQHTYAT